MPAVVIVIGSEVIVDWIKHAFVTRCDDDDDAADDDDDDDKRVDPHIMIMRRFNNIEVSVYGKFTRVLLGDVAFSHNDGNVLDHNFRLARRLGLR